MSAQGSPLSGPSASAAPVPDGGSRERSAVRTVGPPLAAAMAAGAACAWAAVRATAGDRPVVTAAGALAAVLLGVAVALAMSRHRLTRELRHRTDALRAEAARTATAHAVAAKRAAIELDAARRAVRYAEVRRRTAAEAEASLRAALRTETARAAVLEGETARLAEVTVPLALEGLRAGGSAEDVLAGLPRPTGVAHQRLLDVVVREIGAAERMRAAGTAACATTAGRIRALTAATLADLRQMERRHRDQVLGDLLRLDHRTAQAGRLADRIAVLTGSPPARSWAEPVMIGSVLRGASARIDGWRRVRLHPAGTAAVAGDAAEGVMHALAELMDNACAFSPHSREVHVRVRESHAGVYVVVEDAGAAMPDDTLARAQKLVSGDPLDARALSGPRLGLAVVGCLAGTYGLRVTFRPSSLGGTAAVVLIPPGIVTPGAVEEPGAGAGRYADGGGPVAEAAGPAAGASAQVPGQAAGPVPGAVPGPVAGPLPRRARGHSLGASRHDDLAADPPAAWLEPSGDGPPRPRPPREDPSAPSR